MNDAFATRDWPTTGGTVVVSEITEYEDQSDGETMYTANVRYEYFVGGRRFQSDRISLGDHSSSRRASMEAISARYPRDAQVAVYYDVAQPASALIDPGPVWISFVPLAFGCAATFLGLFAALFKRRPGRPAAAETFR